MRTGSRLFCSRMVRTPSDRLAVDLGLESRAIAQPGPSITNSIAIKFDLHSNDGEGTSSTGLYINGAAPTTPSINLLPDNIDLHSGHTFHVALVYDGSTLTLTITDQKHA